MKFLKGLALSILGFLLFLSLSTFGTVLMLNYTFLNPDFVVSQVDRLDVASLAKEVLSKQIPQEGKFMTASLDDAIADLEPWIKEQASAVIYNSYDYLLGKRQSLSIEIPLEPMKESLRETIKERTLQSPPPELAGLPPALIEQNFDQFYQPFSEQIPSTFKFDEGSLPPEILAWLELVRQVIGYIQVSYKPLIGFILFLILCIILIHREVRGSTRSLGTTFLSYGAPWYIGILLTKHFVGPQLAQLGIPPFLQEWLPQLISDSLAPLEMFSLGLLAGGVVLIIVSFVYKPREPSF